MNNLNFIFLEEYKQLDKLCSELYDGQPGVTSYINEMKNVNWNDARDIPNWKSDLNELKRLRHTRNHLAHTEGAFDENLCTNEDVNWVKNFRNRILKQTDPLAMLRKYYKKTIFYKNMDSRAENESSPWADLFLVISVALALITVVCIVIEKILA
jgi:hypothetical protein